MITRRFIGVPFRLLLAASLLLAGIPAIPGHARQAAGLDLLAVDRFLQSQVSANRIPGLAVAIVQGGQIVFMRGYGQASPGIPVTPQTQFYLGSVTKSFTALAAMQLVEQGKLELDAPVQRYLPWFQVADPEASASITVRHLLNHTSGLSEKGDPNASVFAATLEEQARLMRDARLTAPVGSQYQYFNQNYRLLGLLIEQVSGQSYGDYLRTHVFAPLGMVGSTAGPAAAPKLAQGYTRAFGFPVPQSQTFIPGALPSGYLISTAEDMARYLIAQLNEAQYEGGRLVGLESLALMRTPPAGIDSEYGMGWLVVENGNTLFHGGALDYFRCSVALGLKEKTGFVVLFNQNSMVDMLTVNSVIRDGMFALLNGETPKDVSYAWIGWTLIALVVADLLNHLRLFWRLPGWSQKVAHQARAWVWLKVLPGILTPLAVIFGLPPLVQAIQGGSPSWAEPLRLMPDITLWLLIGMGLDLLRGAIKAVLLIRR